MAVEACRAMNEGLFKEGETLEELEFRVKTMTFDVIVVGGGAGGKISTPSTKLGFKVALCERGFDVFGEHKIGLGGTCLNRGCIPSKCLIHVAETITTCNHYELESPGFTVDWPSMVDRVANMVDGTSNNIKKWYSSQFKDKLTYYPGIARFIGHKKLLTTDANGKEIIITAEKIFLAPGSRPNIPQIPGLKDTPYMTSTEALRLREKPESLIVIGAGYIAMEMAFYFGGLSVPIKVLIRSKCLREVDEEIRAEFQRVFSSRFECYQDASPSSVTYNGTEFTVTVSQSGETEIMKASHLLVATGVKCNSDWLNCAASGIDTEAGMNGPIIVDDHLRTSCDDVYAYGDIIGKHLFRHAANYESEYLLETVVRPWSRGEAPIDKPIDLSIMPWAVFTKPQVAGVGPTEGNLIRDHIEYVKGVCPYIKSAMGDALKADHGMVKLLVERGSRRILGGHIVGEQASVMIHHITLLLKMRCTLDDMLDMIYIHPALSELLRNAARLARDALIEAGEALPDSLIVK